MSTATASLTMPFSVFDSAQAEMESPFHVYTEARQECESLFSVFDEAQKTLETPFHAYGGAKGELETNFHIVGDLTLPKVFPCDLSLPKPGQWILVQSDRYGVAEVYAKVSSVRIESILEDTYRVTVEINRVSLKEDILFAKLARRQLALLEEDEDVTEPLDFEDLSTKLEIFTLSVTNANAEYSGSNYSGAAYSGA